jgi:uncharacterized protein (TIGR02453 family)
MAAHFTPALFKFLRDLKAHNDRAWFLANRDRYVADVEAPFLRFITDVGARLPAISKAYVADPRRSGGSMYRIYRDTRFAADKSPYKTWVAASFKHRSSSKDVATPGFYIHIGPKECFAGGGIYHPEMPTLTRIRQHIVADPKGWAAVRKSGVEIEGDVLKRAPAGYDPAHRFIDDLKRKDFYGGAEFSERDVTSPGFLDKYVACCQDVAPLMEFLTKALGLKW